MICGVSRCFLGLWVYMPACRGPPYADVVTEGEAVLLAASAVAWCASHSTNAVRYGVGWAPADPPVALCRMGTWMVPVHAVWAEEPTVHTTTGVYSAKPDWDGLEAWFDFVRYTQEAHAPVHNKNRADVTGPADQLEWIANYLERIMPIIRERSSALLDANVEAAVMAAFDGSAEDYDWIVFDQRGFIRAEHARLRIVAATREDFDDIHRG